MQVTTTSRIACSPERVFDTPADLRNDMKWNGGVSSAELRSAEPIGPGSRFAIVNGGAPYDATLTTYDRPSRLVIEAKGKPDLTIAWTLTPTDEVRSSKATWTSVREDSSSCSSRCSGR